MHSIVTTYIGARYCVGVIRSQASDERHRMKPTSYCMRWSICKLVITKVLKTSLLYKRFRLVFKH